MSPAMRAWIFRLPKLNKLETQTALKGRVVGLLLFP
jgi:hypothetical protein